MRKLLVCSAAALALCGAAQADTLEALKGNTLVVKQPDGDANAYVVKADGRASLTSTNERVLAASGFWNTDADKPGSICLTMRGQAKVCYPLAADKGVGDEWEAKGPTGAVVATLSIAEGAFQLVKGPIPGGDGHEGH